MPVPPINDWDKAIMDVYPHRFASLWAHRGNFELFDEIVDWAKQNFEPGTFTWKSLTFFFKRREDLALFVLRWM